MLSSGRVSLPFFLLPPVSALEALVLRVAFSLGMMMESSGTKDTISESFNRYLDKCSSQLLVLQVVVALVRVEHHPNKGRDSQVKHVPKVLEKSPKAWEV